MTSHDPQRLNPQDFTMCFSKSDVPCDTIIFWGTNFQIGPGLMQSSADEKDAAAGLCDFQA